MKIGDLSRHTSVSVRAIRHYDKLGLLVSKREENGYRTFSPEDIERVRLIQLFLSVGFQLEEIRQYGPCWQTPDSMQDVHDDAILDFYERKVQQIDQQIQGLQQLRNRLDRHMTTLRQRG